MGRARAISCDSDLSLCQHFEYLVSILPHNAAVELCLQQKHRQRLWTDSKPCPLEYSEQFSLAGKQGSNSLSDRLGLDTVDDGVEHRRHKEVDVRHECVDQW